MIQRLLNRKNRLKGKIHSYQEILSFYKYDMHGENMKIDFHTHGKLAKNLPFSEDYTNWLFEEAIHSGLDAICLTEHFNTEEFDVLYKYIAQNYKKSGDSFISHKGLKIFTGIEIDIKEGGHIIFISDIDSVLEMRSKLEEHLKKDNFIRFEELCKLKNGYNCIFGAAHPYRIGSKITSLNMELLYEFDFIDLNGKDTAFYGESNVFKIELLKEKLRCKILAGSDTHQSFQYASLYNVFEKDCNTIKELKEELIKNNYHLYISHEIKSKVKSAGLLKKALKEVHSCGGDYVKLLTNYKSNDEFAKEFCSNE